MADTIKTILLLGAGAGSTDAVLRFKRLGLGIVLVERKEIFDFKKCEPADEIIISDYTDQNFVKFALHMRDIWHFNIVISITESGVEVAAKLNELIGVKGSSLAAIYYLNNKAKMRHVLNTNNFSVVPYQVIKNELDFAEMITTVGFPLIIKPIDGSGSHGIYLIRTVEEAINAVAKLQIQGITPIAEKFIDGKEFSVESFSFDGQHKVIAITEKIVNQHFVEIGHVVPARLERATAKDVAHFVETFLEIVGVTNGPCHTEIKISTDGIKVIESHNRLGGGNISRLVELVYGIDLISLTGQWACNLATPSVSELIPTKAAAIYFFLFPEGEILDLQGLEHVAANPATVEYRCDYFKGDMVPILSSNSGRCGYVIVQENTADEAVDKAMCLANSIFIQTKIAQSFN